jgi:hypothetical protein
MLVDGDVEPWVSRAIAPRGQLQASEKGGADLSA